MASFYLPPRVNDPFVQHARHVIYNTYGDRTKIKPKDLLKFGKTNNADSGAETTIMTLPDGVTEETLLTDNLITVVTSTSAADTQTIVAEGHTLSGTDLTFVVQTVTLTGTAQASLTTPLARCTRLYNSGSTDLAGTVYAFEDGTSTAGVPDTATEVHCMIDAGFNQSQKCATSLSQFDYWIVHFIEASIGRAGGSAAADILVKVREPEGVFRVRDQFTVQSGGPFRQVYEPYFIIPKNSDIRLNVISSTNNLSVTGSINGMLALKY